MGEDGEDERGGDDLDAGRLATETLEGRRARLVVPPPPSRRRRRLAVAGVVLVLVVGVGLGIVPGSRVVGRYPVWELYALAARIDAANARPPSCGSVDDLSGVAPARVNVLTGRVEVDDTRLTLTADEAAMVAEPVYAKVCTGPSPP